MKMSKISLAVGSVLTLAVLNGAAKAAIVSGSSMDAQNTVNAFNGANGGAGYLFNVGPQTQFTGIAGYTGANGGAVTMTSTGDAINTGAYNPLNASAFTTMQLGSGPRAADFAYNNGKLTAGLAKLNYDAVNHTTSTSAGTALNVGAAYLYKVFATTDMGDSFPGLADRELITGAVRFLMGDVTTINVWNGNPMANWYDTVTVSWDTNPYLQSLLSINSDKSYWESFYDPNAYYDEIGDYSIFVLNGILAEYDTPGGNIIGWDFGYDFLYITPAMRQSAVPEPASLSVLALGGLMLLRRRSALK